MRRLLAPAVWLLAFAAAAANAQPPPLRARLVTCQTGARAADRFAVFAGSMPRIPGTAAMSMHFDLFERVPGGRFTRVALPRWRGWERTRKPGAAGFIFTKRVERLAAPADFRAVVRFRWHDDAGRLLRAQRRTTPICSQPDPRPDLVAAALTGAPLDAWRARYTVTVANRGRSDAPGTTARVAGAEVAVAAVPAGDSVPVDAVGPRCRPGERVVVVVDAGRQVDEAREVDDRRSFPCPLPGR